MESSCMIFMKIAAVEVDLKSELMVKDIFANFLFIYLFLTFFSIFQTFRLTA